MQENIQDAYNTHVYTKYSWETTHQNIYLSK